MFPSIFGFVQLAMAAVVVVEGTFQADAGMSKQQKAIDLINNEAQVAGMTFPGSQGIIKSIVNLCVAGFNLANLFSHKAKTAAAAAASPA